MNVLHITANPQEAAIIRNEIANVAPDIQVEASYLPPDASALPRSYGTYDAILFDLNLPNVDAEGVLAQIRQSGHSIPVVAAIGPTDENPPLKLLRAGANDYVVKSGAYFGSLAARLRGAVAQREWSRPTPALTQAEVRLRLIIEAVPAAVMRLNGEGIILALNRHGLALIGATQVEEIVARSFLNLLPQTQQDAVKTFLDNVCAGKRSAVQFNWDALDGKMRRFELYGVPIQGGGEGITNVLGVLTDITQASQMQQDLAETKEQFEQLQLELQQAEAPRREMAEALQMERGQWEAERLRLEQQAKAAEDQTAQLHGLLQRSESDRGELAGKYAAEQKRLEVMGREFELRLKNAETEIAQREQALRTSDSHQSELTEKYAQERLQWESAQQELEIRLKNGADQNAELQQQLQAAEVQSAEYTEQSLQARHQRDELQRSLEQQAGFVQLLEARQIELGKEREDQYARLKASHDVLQHQWEELQSQKALLEATLQTALEQQEILAIAAECAQREQALHILDSNQSELADKHAQEQLQWELEKQELELQLKNSADRITELQRQFQAAERQSAELIEQISQDRDRREKLQAELDQKTSLAQLLEARQFELGKEHEDQYAQLKTSYGELQRLLEEIQSQRASLQISLQTALKQQEELAAENNADAAERALLEQALRTSDSHRSEMAEKYVREQMQLESAKQELEVQLKSSADQNAELRQQLQATERQTADLIEQNFRNRNQIDELQTNLEQQIRRAQLLEERQVELNGELEGKHAQLKTSYNELQHQLEDIQLQRASLQTSLQAALEQQEKLAAEKNADAAERILLEQALRGSDACRSELAEKYAQEQMQWESLAQELELQRKDSSDRIAELIQQLQTVERQSAKLTEQSIRDRNQRDELQKNLEQQIQRGQLREERQAELDKEHGKKYAQLKTSYGELEHRLESIQSQRAAIETSLQTVLGQREKLAAEKNAAEAERTRLEQALHLSDLRQSKMAEHYTQEQICWESARQEFELQLKNTADRNAELLQQLQAAKTQIAELLAQGSQDRQRLDEIQKELQQQVQLAQLLEERRIELVKENEEHLACLQTSHDELQQQLEDLQSQRASLEASLHAAVEQHEELIAEKKAAEASWNDELRILRTQIQTLDGELQESKAAREKMAGLLAEFQLWAPSGGSATKSGSQDSPTVSRQVDLARVHRLIEDTEHRYESFVRHKSDSHQKLLSEVLTCAQRDNEEWKRILSAQNAGEREYLELMLHKAETRIQRIEEQYKKEREQLELDFQAQENRCFRLSEFCLVGLSVSTVDGHLLDCDDAFARILGYKSSEEVLAQADDEALKALVRNEPPEGAFGAREVTRRVERCVRRKDGQLIWLLENSALISRGVEADTVVEKIIIDVTERRRLYGEIRRVRRLEAVSQLAAAAVQEFRNVLNSTMESSSLALQTLDEHDPRRARTEQIREMVNRASRLAQQLSEVIQGQGPEPAGLDANETLGEMTSVLRLLAGDDVSLLLKPGAGIGAVAIERSKFEQVITALVVAARDCLPAGGTVSVELSPGEADPTTASHPCLLLTVGAEGFDVQLPQRTATLNHVVASCQGQLQTGGKSGKEASYRLFLPLVT